MHRKIAPAVLGFPVPLPLPGTVVRLQSIGSSARRSRNQIKLLDAIRTLARRE